MDKLCPRKKVENVRDVFDAGILQAADNVLWKL